MVAHDLARSAYFVAFFLISNGVSGFLQPSVSLRSYSVARRSWGSATTVCRVQTPERGNNIDDDDGDDFAVRPWPEKSTRSKNYVLAKGEVAVRFINAPGRFPSDGQNDVIAAAKPGEVVIAVADAVGIHIPRGCMTGLCGTCTCDMEDPSFPGSRGVLRACSTLVSVPEGCDEMVVDLYRMLTKSGKPKADPMARFEKLDDPNEGFKARWNLPDAGAGVARQDCRVCGAKGVDSKGAMPDDCSVAPGCPFRKK